MADQTQRELIEEKSKPIEQRPVMMNRNSGAFGAIGSEFQDWLIVAEPELKDKVISHLEKTKSSDSDRIRKRNKLSTQFGNTRLSRIDKDVGFFNRGVQATNDLIGEVRSTSVEGSGGIPADVTDMATDLKSGQLEASHRQRNGQFSYDLIQFNLRNEKLYEQNLAETQRQRSWAPVLQQYKG